MSYPGAPVTNQPQMVQMQAQLPLEQWKHSTFSCFDDCGNCLYTWCCPTCAMASARTNFDESNFCFNCLCLSVPVLRSIIREGYHIEGTCVGDILCGVCCGACTVCQALNEVKTRGMVKTQWGANRAPTPEDFKYGLCSCFSDCGNCLLGCLCPSIAYAMARSNFDSSNCCFNCMCVNPCLTRSIIREGYNIKGTCCGDCFLPFLCGPLVACQLLNEVKHRGEISKTIIVVPKQ